MMMKSFSSRAPFIPALLAAVSLAACSPAADDSANASADADAPTEIALANSGMANAADAGAAMAQARPVLAVEGEGLRLFTRNTGAASPLPFGTARDQVVTALASLGKPETGTNGECGAGPLDYATWPDGLTVYFQKAAFVGWALDERAKGKHSTAIGIAPGSTRRDLSDAYTVLFEETSIGTEFAAGKLYGVLDKATPDAQITNMWAGVSCVMR